MQFTQKSKSEKPRSKHILKLIFKKNVRMQNAEFRIEER